VLGGGARDISRARFSHTSLQSDITPASSPVRNSRPVLGRRMPGALFQPASSAIIMAFTPEGATLCRLYYYPGIDMTLPESGHYYCPFMIAKWHLTELVVRMLRYLVLVRVS